MARKSALQKIESHEKLCRIMQKQTFEQIKEMKERIKRLEYWIVGGMGAVLITLLMTSQMITTATFGIGMFFYGMICICIGATIAYYVINKIQKTPEQIEQEENEKYLKELKENYNETITKLYFIRA